MKTKTYRKTEFAPDSYLLDWTSANLPDSENYFITDLDMVIRDRSGNMLILEVKRNGSNLRTHQSITFQIIDQALKNLGPAVNISISGYTFSLPVNYHGLHVLTFERTTFENGSIFLDGTPTTEDQLQKFLSFDFT